MKTRLKELRELNELFQKDLCDYLSITQAQYSRIECGKHELSYDGLIKLSNFYETSIDYIMGLTDVKKPYPRIRKICDNE